jgi:hypothetical protein
MKKLEPPAHDDEKALDLLADNRLLKSYPKLKRLVPVLKRAYANYVGASGNAASISRTRVGHVRGKLLVTHYSNLPKVLSHIRQMRDDASHLCCPMCGSFHSGTLDHLLPKEDHPGLAIFSKNLVPACNCNTKRGRNTIGVEAGERILHPYFDSCLSNRLIVARFSDLSAVPVVELAIAVSPATAEYKAIAFHVDFVRGKTALKQYLADRWVNMCRRPSLVVRSLANRPESLAILKQTLEGELDRLDDEHRSKNNWNSIFVAGLLADDVLNWLYARLTIPGRVDDSGIVDGL